MSLESYRVPLPRNEPVLSYAPGSPERRELKAKLLELKSRTVEIPLIIGGKEVRTGRVQECRAPHDHSLLLARCHLAGKEEVGAALEAALAARARWAATPWHVRASVFLKAAELLAGPWRATLNAAAMLGQSKTAHQAEIDAACEFIDYLRFNAFFMQRIAEDQPIAGPGAWNRVEYRPLEGFVLAISPFNFTSIAGNLAAAPALMGNVVLWKSARSAVYPAHFILELFRESGLPDGVITLIHGQGGDVAGQVAGHHFFAGLHFTGSREVFLDLNRRIASAVAGMRSVPRVVAETGGKDFMVVHASADVGEVAANVVRGGFEYQGQKCSAVSRVYAPESMWPELRDRLAAQIGEIRVGDVCDFRNFMGAVIDRTAFDRIAGAIEFARGSGKAEIVAGGKCDSRDGWFVQPTLLRVDDPKLKTMEEEIFGPVVSVFVYPDAAWGDVLRLCDETSPYALTGSVFARDRGAILEAERALVNAAGNFYINDKPTGAIVGQQPFGGGRASGTNDKAGSALNLLRWVSPRTIKETFVPPRDWRYPFMSEP